MKLNKLAIGLGVAVIALAMLSGYLFIQNQSLATQNQNLEIWYNAFQPTIDNLTQTNNNLQSQLSSLQSDYNILQQKYDGYVSVYTSLENDVINLAQTFRTYTDIPDAFPRVLNAGEMTKVASAVSSATGNSTNSWPSWQAMYNYIHANIEYVNDIDFPNLALVTNTSDSGPLAGTQFLTHVHVQWIRSTIQAPSLTLSVGQGDCEDTAILCYAMMKYHMLNIEETNYNLYLALIKFNDGMSHMAVFLPVTGGRLCILDNAGNYLTSSGGSITQNAASFELNSYANFMSHEGIKNIILYDINVNSGNYTIFASGTIPQITNALGG